MDLADFVWQFSRQGSFSPFRHPKFASGTSEIREKRLGDEATRDGRERKKSTITSFDRSVPACCDLSYCLFTSRPHGEAHCRCKGVIVGSRVSCQG